MTIRIPNRALVILVGPSGAGKSTWAARWFRASQVVSTDSLRAVVGEHEHDQRAGTDAFDVLHLVVERRLRRGLLTVIDSLGLAADDRDRWRALAAAHGRRCVAVVFDEPDNVCRARNKARPRPVPADVLTRQLRRFRAVVGELSAEPFDAVHPAGPAAVVPDEFADAPGAAARQGERPARLRFGLQVSSFTWPGERDAIADRLGSLAAEAEEAGFSSLWVMDHFLQIPQVGREWEPMLDSYTTLGFLAGRTSEIALGALVTGVTYRNVAHLAKIVATLDVLSGGRARCGLGAAWFEREHVAYGFGFPGLRERYELLEDALQLLPLMWGPGSPPFHGRRVDVPEAICYPRPVQERVPILVGGSGERRTLALVARYADACNLFGGPEVVGRKIEVLHRHCAAAERDPSEITVTQLSSALCAPDRDALARRIDDLRDGRTSPEDFASRARAGTVDDHVGRFRLLAEAGVQEAIVSLADVGMPGSVERFAPVIEAFAG